MKRPDPLLRLVPWRIFQVFAPVEQVLSQIETYGTVDAAGRQIVFKVDGQLYDLPAALRGLIEFHELTARRHGFLVDVGPLVRFANRLEAGTPIFEQDLSDVRSSIASCKQQAMKLRVSEAAAIVQTVQIGMEIDKLNRRAA